MTSDPGPRPRVVRPLRARVFLLLATIATFLGVVAICLAIQQCDIAWRERGNPAPVVTSAILAALCFLVAYGLYAIGRLVGRGLT